MIEKFNQIIPLCESTQTEIKNAYLRGFGSGTWIAARQQKIGQGRQGRVWESVEGNLHLSFLLKIEDFKNLTWTSLLVAYGVLSVLQELKLSDEIKIKWPNDLYFCDKKLCGILIDLIDQKKGILAIGVGLNCIESPELNEGLKKTTSLFEITGEKINFEELILPIVEKNHVLMNKIKAEETQWLENAYFKHSYFQNGDHVLYAENQLGIVCGLGKDAELLIEDQTKTMIKIFSDEVIRVKKA